MKRVRKPAGNGSDGKLGHGSSWKHVKTTCTNSLKIHLTCEFLVISIGFARILINMPVYGKFLTSAISRSGILDFIDDFNYFSTQDFLLFNKLCQGSLLCPLSRLPDLIPLVNILYGVMGLSIKSKQKDVNLLAFSKKYLEANALK